MLATPELLNRILDPVGKALSPEAARQLLALRADDDTQSLIDGLADRANEGSLTAEERAEYESLIGAASLVAILQWKARFVPAGNFVA
jgi:hypothetical protein